MKSSAKIERAKYGPGLVEVTLGAVLSLMLGVLLATAYLVTKPVATVRELPKKEDRVRGQVYFIEGSKDANKGRTWLRKRQLLLEGQTAEIPLTEDELNTGLNEAPKPAESGASQALIEPSSVNFRIREGDLQVALPSTLNLIGYRIPVLVQARGGFERDGDRFIFVPDEFYIGSLAANRLPFLRGMVTSRLLAAKTVGSELIEAWGKVSAVSINGDTLQLTLP
ncbi:hypothetical protein MASR2M8_04660 [Opitutaceae bacterium]